MHKFLTAALISATLAGPAALPFLSPVHAAEAVQTADLRAMILDAAKSGQSRLVIPPSIYRVSPKGNDSNIITLNGTKNLEIVADGVTMVCTKRMRAIQLNKCENVTLRGLTLDYDPVTFTQGKVTSIDPEKNWIDITLDAGYPVYLASRTVICDPKTRFHKYGVDHMWDTKAAWSAPGVIRISTKGIGNKADLGDPVALSAGQETGNCHAITVEQGCKNVVFRNVTINCAPGMGLVDTDNETGIKMFGCKIVPGPKPAGATEERLLTTSWDGIQCQAARIGSQVEDCVIERCGDDSWSVPSMTYKVLEKDGAILRIKGPEWGQKDGHFQVGDPIFSSPNGIRSTAPLQSVKQVQLQVDGKPVNGIELTLAKEINVQVGQSIWNENYLSKGFTYRNNKIYSHGRGALVKVSDGIIEGNTFRGGDKAIIVDPEMNVGGSDNLIIRNNKIIETGYHQAMPWSEQTGAICLASWAGNSKFRPAEAFNNILIENNTFERVKGLNLFIACARNVTVKNNRFIDTHTTDPGTRHNGADYGIDAKNVIGVTQSDGVKFIGNVIKHMGPYAKAPLWLSPTATHIEGADTGIKVEK